MRTAKSASSVVSAFALTLAACSGGNTIDSDVSADEGMFVARDSAALQLAERRAYDFIYAEPDVFLDGVDEVTTSRVKVDDLLMAHTRLQQTIAGIPVLFGEAIIHLGRDGSLRGVTDHFIRHISVDLVPALKASEAVNVAVAKFGGWAKVTNRPHGELYVVRQGGVDYLAYRVEIEQLRPSDTPSIPVAFVDAQSGVIIMTYDNLQTARNRRTHTANNGTSLPGTLVRNEASGPSGDAVLDQAHDAAGLTYDYYAQTFGRDSYNNNGATITSTVHYSNNYVNAFWNGTQMVFGDGDGVNSGPLTTVDIMAHELTHAVTSSESNLVYLNESGALNEALSDIFAAAVEAYRDGGVNENTWKLGEETWTPGTPGDALRYMNDPAAAGDRDYYPDRYQGPADNGGVHTNSGIANLAFYLLSEGGTHPRGKTTTVVPAIGIEKAAAIFYRANTTYLTSNSNFAAARTATVNAATDLYGQAEIDAVNAAWDAVGAPGGGSDPGPGPGGDLSCQGNCNGQAPGGCFCDFWCLFFGDCCDDYLFVCSL